MNLEHVSVQITRYRLLAGLSAQPKGLQQILSQYGIANGVNKNYRDHMRYLVNSGWAREGRGSWGITYTITKSGEIQLDEWFYLYGPVPPAQRKPRKKSVFLQAVAS